MIQKISKQDLIKLICIKLNNQQTEPYKQKSVHNMLNATLDVIMDMLSQDYMISLIKFGTFKTQIRKSRTGRNPITGDELIIPETKVVSFSPGSELKHMVKSSLNHRKTDTGSRRTT